MRLVLDTNNVVSGLFGIDAHLRRTKFAK